MASSSPLSDRITLRQVIAVATKSGWQLEQTEATYEGPRGGVRFRFLRRKQGESTVTVDLANLADDDELSGSMLRRLCDLLAIPPSLFGLGPD